MPDAMHTPSEQQQTIYDWVREGAGHGLVIAVAGSGKTTTLVEASQYLATRSALFCAFNKHIQQELTQRLAGRMVCRTVHSLGFAALQRALGHDTLTVDEDKVWQLARPLITAHFKGRRVGSQVFMRYLFATKEAVHYAKVTLAKVRDPEPLARLVRDYRLDIPARDLEWWHPIVKEILRQDTELAQKQGLLDFDDQIWLPHLLDLPQPQHDWVFIDECQDLSAAQLDLIARCLSLAGRLLAVGDPRQAIYAFAGADAGSVDRIRSRFHPTELPLSTTYRCPTSVVQLARLYVPDIRARPEAPSGKSQTLSPEMFLAEVREGDLILSRRTAPLIACCLDLIARKLPARVKGRDIGRELLAALKAVREPLPYSVATMQEALSDVSQDELAAAERSANPGAKTQEVLDRFDAVMICVETFDQVHSLGELRQEIAQLFSDDRAPITLSTVHRAKGLEADRVFLIAVEELPLRWPGQQRVELEQELNLKYVAITRAKSCLFWVTSVPQPVEQLARTGLDAFATLFPAPEAEVDTSGTGWQVGDRVVHPRFGEGVVARVEQSKATSARESTTILHIHFADGRLRRIVPEVGKLRRA